jgi:hypothetical protein
MVADRRLVVSPGPRAQIGSDQPSMGVLPPMMPAAEEPRIHLDGRRRQERQVRGAPGAGQTVRGAQGQR